VEKYIGDVINHKVGGHKNHLHVRLRRCE
jgi:hypothetical protein